MNMISAGGTVQVFNALSPNWADISAGYAYAVILVNQTDADITAGEFTIQAAPALPDDACKPDDTKWADIDVLPGCDDAPGTVSVPAKITLSATTPLKAHSQCAYSVPCPTGQFVRVVATGGTGVGVFVVVTRLRRVWY